MEAELGEEKWQFIDGCQRDWDTLPLPRPPLTVGLDGGFIHAKDRKPSPRDFWSLEGDQPTTNNIMRLSELTLATGSPNRTLSPREVPVPQPA